MLTCLQRRRQTRDECWACFQRMRPVSIRTRRIISVTKAERTLILLRFVCEIMQEPIQVERRGIMPEGQSRSCVCDDHPYRGPDLLYAKAVMLPSHTAKASEMTSLLRSQIAALRTLSFRGIQMQQ